MYSLEQFLHNAVGDVQKDLPDEASFRTQVMVPYLQQLGYDPNDLDFDREIAVRSGRKAITVSASITINVNGKPEYIIGTKSPRDALTERDALHVLSCAKLAGEIPAVFCTATNGRETASQNTFTGEVFDGILTPNQLLECVNTICRHSLTEAESDSAKRTLYTLSDGHNLYKRIGEAKTIIEKEALIRTDQSFREITKIFLVKMSEERRAAEGKQNRFSLSYLESWVKAHSGAQNGASDDITILTAFRSLLSEAVERYPGIYGSSDAADLQTANAHALARVVELFEPYNISGTGDDIKGAAYEIFLKGTLRGDADQYFTPREIVSFMVRRADPGAEDRFVDPACGSGGFLIQAFRHVRKKLDAIPDRKKSHQKCRELVEKQIWGAEGDPDLHILAKMNLILHGDGWNHIYCGDTLVSGDLPEEYFDIVFANPPFTIPYSDPSVLARYENGTGRKKQELDILFFEKSLRLLKPGGKLYIVLPEGLLNLRTYTDFRKWILSHCDLQCVVSLPEGAFKPMGNSVSKTCILGVRKKSGPCGKNADATEYAFVGIAKKIGYTCGKTEYKPEPYNDLEEFLADGSGVRERICVTAGGGEYTWINHAALSRAIGENGQYAFSAGLLINAVTADQMNDGWEMIRLGECFEAGRDSQIRICDSEDYYYLEVPDISENTGLITNIRKLRGSSIAAGSLLRIEPGDILCSGINPRKRRIAVVPDVYESDEDAKIPIVTSGEIIVLRHIANQILPWDERYSIVPVLRSGPSTRKMVRAGTGSSSSRARVHAESLSGLTVCIPPAEIRRKLHALVMRNVREIWNASQNAMKRAETISRLLGDNERKDAMRSV